MEDQIRQQLTEAMPGIIEAMKLKSNMLHEELYRAKKYGGTTQGERLHIHYLQEEIVKTDNLLIKIQD